MAKTMKVNNKDVALDLLARLGAVDRDELRPESELVGDLGIDSPKALQLVVELEEALEIEISDETVAQLNTVGDILAEVERGSG